MNDDTTSNTRRNKSSNRKKGKDKKISWKPISVGQPRSSEGAPSPPGSEKFSSSCGENEKDDNTDPPHPRGYGSGGKSAWDMPPRRNEEVGNSTSSSPSSSPLREGNTGNTPGSSSDTIIRDGGQQSPVGYGYGYDMQGKTKSGMQGKKRVDGPLYKRWEKGEEEDNRAARVSSSLRGIISGALAEQGVQHSAPLNPLRDEKGTSEGAPERDKLGRRTRKAMSDPVTPSGEPLLSPEMDIIPSLIMAKSDSYPRLLDEYELAHPRITPPFEDDFEYASTRHWNCFDVGTFGNRSEKSDQTIFTNCDASGNTNIELSQQHLDAEKADEEGDASKRARVDLASPKTGPLNTYLDARSEDSSNNSGPPSKASSLFLSELLLGLPRTTTQRLTAIAEERPSQVRTFPLDPDEEQRSCYQLDTPSFVEMAQQNITEEQRKVHIELKHMGDDDGGTAGCASASKERIENLPRSVTWLAKSAEKISISLGEAAQAYGSGGVGGFSIEEPPSSFTAPAKGAQRVFLLLIMGVGLINFDSGGVAAIMHKFSKGCVYHVEVPPLNVTETEIVAAAIRGKTEYDLMSWTLKQEIDLTDWDLEAKRRDINSKLGASSTVYSLLPRDRLLFHYPNSPYQDTDEWDNYFKAPINANAQVYVNTTRVYCLASGLADCNGRFLIIKRKNGTVINPDITYVSGSFPKWNFLVYLNDTGLDLVSAVGIVEPEKIIESVVPLQVTQQEILHYFTLDPDDDAYRELSLDFGANMEFLGNSSHTIFQPFIRLNRELEFDLINTPLVFIRTDEQYEPRDELIFPCFSQNDIGILGAIPFLGVCVGCLLFGKVIGKPKLQRFLITSGVFFSALALVGLICTVRKEGMWVSRFLCGLSQCPVSTLVPVWIARFGEMQRTRWMGMYQAASAVGAIGGYAVFGYMTALGMHYAWGFLFQAALLCIISMALWTTPAEQINGPQISQIQSKKRKYYIPSLGSDSGRFREKNNALGSPSLEPAASPMVGADVRPTLAKSLPASSKFILPKASSPQEFAKKKARAASSSSEPPHKRIGASAMESTKKMGGRMDASLEPPQKSAPSSSSEANKKMAASSSEPLLKSGQVEKSTRNSEKSDWSPWEASDSPRNEWVGHTTRYSANREEESAIYWRDKTGKCRSGKSEPDARTTSGSHATTLASITLARAPTVGLMHAQDRPLTSLQAEFRIIGSIPFYWYCCLVSCGLFFCVTGIQVWATKFFLDGFLRTILDVTSCFLVVAISAPFFGLFLGSYNQQHFSTPSELQKGLKFIFTTSIGAVLAGLGSLLVPLPTDALALGCTQSNVETAVSKLCISYHEGVQVLPPDNDGVDPAIGCRFAKECYDLSHTSGMQMHYMISLSLMWLVLFFGGALLPVCATMQLCSVPEHVRNVASALNLFVTHLFGFALGAWLPGWAAEQFSSSVNEFNDLRITMATVFLMPTIGIIGISLAYAVLNTLKMYR